MAKLTLSTISSRYASVAALNQNFSDIATAIENTLSRDGTSPNQMESDLDMNGYRILNALAEGGEGFVWMGNWTTATDYELNNLVYVPTNLGSSHDGKCLICLANHTSGTLDTDYSAGKWATLVARGASGAGSGDLVSTNNLSDVNNASTSLTNLGGTTVGKNVFTAASATAAQQAMDVEVGVDVQAYSATTANTASDQDWTGSHRVTALTDNDGSFDMDARLDFVCTPSGNITIVFTNYAFGQRGSIYLDNSGGHIISLTASRILAPAGAATTLSSTGKYWLSYWCVDETSSAEVVLLSITSALS